VRYPASSFPPLVLNPIHLPRLLLFICQPCSTLPRPHSQSSKLSYSALAFGAACLLSPPAGAAAHYRPSRPCARPDSHSRGCPCPFASPAAPPLPHSQSSNLSYSTSAFGSAHLPSHPPPPGQPRTIVLPAPCARPDSPSAAALVHLPAPQHSPPPTFAVKQAELLCFGIWHRAPSVASLQPGQLRTIVLPPDSPSHGCPCPFASPAAPLPHAQSSKLRTPLWHLAPRAAAPPSHIRSRASWATPLWHLAPRAFRRLALWGSCALSSFPSLVLNRIHLPAAALCPFASPTALSPLPHSQSSKLSYSSLAQHAFRRLPPAGAAAHYHPSRPLRSTPFTFLQLPLSMRQPCSPPPLSHIRSRAS